ncbi:MAG: recombinase family protein, partial [Clostridia bacterium]|nr:recombinase family protein [Clostridia bacterium]
IKANENWIYVGTYVDDGFSGTNTDHRQGFQKLMQDAMDGKIDLIITKAVSRFARNLLDCIKWVEALQNHDPPIRVFFEQENLDTMSQTSGIILFVLAMVAEEESHMKSEAILLSLEWRFSRGRFLTPRLFGFDKVEVPDGYGGHKKVLQINESEANVVRWMYSALLSGMTPEEIAGMLTDLAIPTGGRKKDGSYNTHWTKSTVVSIMRNEKHCGDVLARKTYTKSFKDHKARKNTGQKNKYYQANHHDAIVSRTVWNAAQRILNSRRYGHEGMYLPMRIIDNGSLTGFISMNRSWAGFDAEDYYRASQIAMGLLDGELEANLEQEFLPESGHRMGGLMDDHGIAQIARDLTAAEQEMKNELEGKKKDAEGESDREEIVKTFQVVSGDMFSRIHEPVVRITTSAIAFNKSCVDKMTCQYAELLFNPVERMLVLRPCAVDHPNAISWNAKGCGASSLCKVLFATMGWEDDYSYRVPCQPLEGPNEEIVLVFDLDNYVGHAINKTEEVIVARKQMEMEMDNSGKSYFYPPEDDDEPQEIKDMEEKFQKAVEVNKKIFGVPAFEHASNVRAFSQGETWDMMTPARPLDIVHTVDSATVDNLFEQIMNAPPTIPVENDNSMLQAHVVTSQNPNNESR